ncbi:MAG: UvrD-helicase domain-containing protein, partial [Gemmatimonadetes bacterium]|nr:UvrD-helicase domain-containing protein [Gemmatimonadota bacterium]
MAKRKLQDQQARDRIQKDALDSNMVVMAGAGAGKTHALVERMVNYVRTVSPEIDRIAAITFTRKAAGEMRGR